MKVSVRLFGALSEFGREPLDFNFDGERCVADLRQALETRLSASWPAFRPGLLRCSAFADERQVLRERDPLPADGQLAVLPPVSGG